MAGHVEAGGPTESALALGIALRFQYFPDDPAPVILAAPIEASSATLWSFQWVLTVRPRFTGTRIPLSVTFANRTEERKEKDTRMSIGIAYDFDAVFARVRP